MPADTERPSFRDEHLTDVEIDAYWGGRLPDEDVRRVEAHYVDCTPCQARVNAAEHAVEVQPALPEEPPEVHVSPWWRLATAILAALSLVLAWQWVRTSGRERAVTTALADQRRLADATRDDIVTLHLTPRPRASAAPAALPATSAIVAVWIDVADVGERAARFAVAIRSATATSPIVAVSGLVPSIERRLVVPVSGSLLPPGDYVAALSSGSNSDVVLPFTITAR
jgi:hypothetical protein